MAHKYFLQLRRRTLLYFSFVPVTSYFRHAWLPVHDVTLKIFLFQIVIPKPSLAQFFQGFTALFPKGIARNQQALQRRVRVQRIGNGDQPHVPDGVAAEIELRAFSALIEQCKDTRERLLNRRARLQRRPGTRTRRVPLLKASDRAEFYASRPSKST